MEKVYIEDFPLSFSGYVCIFAMHIETALISAKLEQWFPLKKCCLNCKRHTAVEGNGLLNACSVEIAPWRRRCHAAFCLTEQETFRSGKRRYKTNDGIVAWVQSHVESAFWEDSSTWRHFLDCCIIKVRTMTPRCAVLIRWAHIHVWPRF